MGGDELNDVVHDVYALLDDEVMTDEDAANPPEFGEESDWRIY